MSAYIGFAGKIESPVDFISTGLKDIWTDYASKNWSWKLSNDLGQSDLGFAIQSGINLDTWKISRMKLTDQDPMDPFSSSLADINQARHLLPTSSATIFEITRTAYSGCHAPIDTTKFGAMGVVGEITGFMEDVVGVKKNSLDPMVGGGLGFIKWLNESNDETHLNEVAACDTHAIYIAACNPEQVLLVRSQGAVMERQFIARSSGSVIFSSSRFPLSKTGVTNIEQISPGTIKTYPVDSD